MKLFVTVALLAAAMIAAGALPTFAKQAKTKGEGRGVDAGACEVPGTTYPSIQDAVDDPGCQTIVLNNVDSLESGITIDRDVTITAAERPGLPPAVGSSGERVFTILPGNTVTFEDFDIHDAGGASVEQGGGIYNQGTLYLCGAKVSGNQAPPGTEGDIAGTPAQQCPTSPGPGGPLEGESVLVEHKGKKELCLPEAALKGHLKHGDETIDEQGCSDTDQEGSRRGSK
jgi:hypothetical protein